MSATLEGTTIGRFRVGRLLGKGGMGAVYAAFDEHLERDVALKVLHEEGESSIQKKRLMREARIAAKLQHPNIATIYEVEELEGNLFIVMELLEGQALRRALHERKLDVDEAIQIARDMARGLARAHAAGFIHRDIKPENVFLTTLGPDTVLTKVLDFGLARQKPAPVAADHKDPEHTSTGTSRGDMWGTPGYVSPEQALGQTVDVRTDVFSFGVVFYEMLANIRPFRGETAVATMIATTRAPERPLREIIPQLPPEIDAIVTRCLAKKKEDRFADCGEVSAAIEAFMRGGVPASVRNPAKQPSRPSYPGTNPLMSGGGDAPTTGSAAISLTTREDTLVAIEHQRRDKIRLAILVGAGLGLAILVLVLGVSFAAHRSHDVAAAASGSASALAVSAPPDPVIEPATPLPEPSADPDPAPTPSAVAMAAPAPHPRPAGNAPKKVVDCRNKFTTDAKGVRIPKLECFKDK